MKRILVATTNPDKLREIRHILGDAGVDVIGLDAFPPVAEPQETGATFEENARQKALYYADRFVGARHASPLPWVAEPLLCVAEDSGLEIDALDGEPGVRSARFLGPTATYPDRFAEILMRLSARPDRPRTARFVAAVAAVKNGHVVFETRGTIEGEIARLARGAAGFGYDPIFFYPPYGSTLAEVSAAEKITVAHRGKAFRALAAWLTEDRGPETGD